MTNRKLAFRFGVSCAAAVACLGISVVLSFLGMKGLSLMNGCLAGLNAYTAYMVFKEIKNV